MGQGETEYMYKEVVKENTSAAGESQFSFKEEVKEKMSAAGED